MSWKKLFSSYNSRFVIVFYNWCDVDKRSSFIEQRGFWSLFRAQLFSKRCIVLRRMSFFAGWTTVCTNCSRFWTLGGCEINIFMKRKFVNGGGYNNKCSFCRWSLLVVFFACYCCNCACFWCCKWYYYTFRKEPICMFYQSFYDSS